MDQPWYSQIIISDQTRTLINTTVLRGMEGRSACPSRWMVPPLSCVKSSQDKKSKKTRFDIAILRAIKCAELMKTGYMIKPDSPMAPLCADIVNIKAYEKSLEPPKPEPKPEPEPPIWQKYPDLVNNDLSDAS